MEMDPLGCVEPWENFSWSPCLYKQFDSKMYSQCMGHIWDSDLWDSGQRTETYLLSNRGVQRGPTPLIQAWDPFFVFLLSACHSCLISYLVPRTKGSSAVITHNALAFHDLFILNPHTDVLMFAAPGVVY